MSDALITAAQVVGMVALAVTLVTGLKAWDRWLLARFDRQIGGPRVVEDWFAEDELVRICHEPGWAATLADIDALDEVAS